MKKRGATENTRAEFMLKFKLISELMRLAANSSTNAAFFVLLYNIVAGCFCPLLNKPRDKQETSSPVIHKDFL